MACPPGFADRQGDTDLRRATPNWHAVERVTRVSARFTWPRAGTDAATPWLVPQHASVTIGCPIVFRYERTANPYRIEFAGALVLLVAVFVVWRRIRPRPHALLRWYAGISGGFALFMIELQDFGGRRCITVETSYRLALEASLLVAASLLFELLRALHDHRIARAVARRRSCRATGS